MKPLLMNFGEPCRDFGEIEGEYNVETQKWSRRDLTMSTTWSRTSTTGVFTSDPDEDKDD